MTIKTRRDYREWSRYQWAGVHPSPAEPAVARWNLVEWVGETGGRRPTLVTPAEMPAGDGGFSGFGHNPGGTHWAEGYRH